MAEKHFNMVEEYKYSQVESYGVTPPERANPIWGNENPTEEDIVISIDFKVSFQKLTQHEQKVISLFNKGYSTREIAVILKIPTMTASDTKNRAIGKMREMMS